MASESRLKRLEAAVAHYREGYQTRFERAIAETEAMGSWLQERGYPDALAAVEAGETGPAGLEDLLREEAKHDVGHRAWERIQKALRDGELPREEDFRLLNVGE